MLKSFFFFEVVFLLSMAVRLQGTKLLPEILRNSSWSHQSTRESTWSAQDDASCSSNPSCLRGKTILYGSISWRVSFMCESRHMWDVHSVPWWKQALVGLCCGGKTTCLQWIKPTGPQLCRWPLQNWTLSLFSTCRPPWDCLHRQISCVFLLVKNETVTPRWTMLHGVL